MGGRFVYRNRVLVSFCWKKGLFGLKFRITKAFVIGNVESRFLFVVYRKQNFLFLP